MSLHEYKVSRDIALQDYPFYALIMAAIRRADTDNLKKLTTAFPGVVAEFKARYNAGGGYLSQEEYEHDEEADAS